MDMAFRFWLMCSRNAAIIAMMFMVAGVFLAALSAILGLHAVYFEGIIAGVEVRGFENSGNFRKQVGYFWAPNWSFAGFFFFPLIIGSILLAISTIEPLLRNLVRSGMLLRDDFSHLDEEMVVLAWKKKAESWANLSLAVGIITVLFIIFADFYPVVLKWLLLENAQLSEEFIRTDNPILFNDPNHEFDWSIASLFGDASGTRIFNIIFSSIAYLIIPITGSALVFSGFIFLGSFCAFFSGKAFSDMNLILVPDLKSKDKRLGFERFENFFHHVIVATVATGVLSVGMHLQNVYLRSNSYSNILEMIFGNMNEKFQNGLENVTLNDILLYLEPMNKIIDMGNLSTSLQTYASTLILFILSIIVFIGIYALLRKSVLDGRNIYTTQRKLSEKEEESLKKMTAWPVGWVSLNNFIIINILIILSMWYVNFLSLVLIFFIFKLAASIFSLIKAHVWK